MTESKKTILIVEDEVSMLEIIKDKFTKEGFEVITAKNGQEGLDQALQNHPDLILLDVIMPIMDGMTMLEKLRQDDWGQYVPAIILTNLNEVKTAAVAMEEGVYDFLVKTDWKLEEVVAKVREKLNV